MILPSTPESEPKRPVIKQPSTLDNVDIFNRSDYFVEDQIGFQSGSQRRSGLKLVLWSWMSAFIDSLILISISCFSMIVFTYLMKTQTGDIFRFISVEPNFIKMFTLSFLFSFWVYLIMMRVFMGASLGEWSCQLRLGQPVQRIKISYIFRVIGRTSLILVTGIIILPICSLVFKRDIIGDITGLRIYSLM